MTKYALLITTVCLVTFFSTANAAFCSLRDPNIAISNLYDDQVTFRSMVSVITDKDRDAVSERLPFTLHRNEIGKHTLYVILKDKKAAGFVQARSELSDWGVIEIAWAINLDMTIRDFFFQRCRSSLCRSDKVAELHQLVQGKTFHELRDLLNSAGEIDFSLLDEDLSEIAHILQLIVQSALKTIAVTESAWQHDIAPYQLSMNDR
ncbi:hypothetical protein SG34_032115 [Thalassomonas viridans]|uniref:Uncharacterized protein n=1 Tax=Thalassomonas viridans TaxID=137584 RepID=A0AAE9Z9L5_9GAMM|nr:hypothetical protein [Thalassomonas viridans]WDE08570.1 hypothetical protein SG34_032115 [Thalassomonas viridans]